MKKIFRIRYLVLLLVAGIVAFAIHLATYLGAFRPVKISEGPAEPFHLLAKNHVGAYHKIVPVIQEVEAWAKQHGIDCTQSFGLYMNNPRTTEEERLRSKGGCWIAQDKLENLPADFSLETWSAPWFVKAVFEGSPGIGPMKVYPRVSDYITEKGLTPLPGTLEVYVIHSDREMTTTYYFPVEKPAEKK